MRALTRAQERLRSAIYRRGIRGLPGAKGWTAFGCPTWAAVHLPGPEAGTAWMCGGISIGKKRLDVQRFPDDTRRADLTAWIRTRGKVESNVREIRGKNAWTASPYWLKVARGALPTPAVPLGSDVRKHALAARAEG